MIRDAARQERLLADIRRFVREVAIPNEDRVEREDHIPDEDIALAFIELSQCSVTYRVHGATNAGSGIGCHGTAGAGGVSAFLIERGTPGLSTGGSTPKMGQEGAPIGEFQLVQAMLAKSKIEIEAARALILQTARKHDNGEDVNADVSMCKYYVTEMCGRGIERFYRDVRAFRIYEGTSQIHLLNIGKHLLR